MMAEKALMVAAIEAPAPERAMMASAMVVVEVMTGVAIILVTVVWKKCGVGKT